MYGLISPLKPPNWRRYGDSGHLEEVYESHTDHTGRYRTMSPERPPFQLDVTEGPVAVTTGTFWPRDTRLTRRRIARLHSTSY